MAFDGRDYHQMFEEACSDLEHLDVDMESRDSLEAIEWVLWEAIRGVFFYVAIIVPTIVFITIELAFSLSENMATLTALAYWTVVIVPPALILYWLFRFVFWHEISRHVKGRTFGDGGLLGGPMGSRAGMMLGPQIAKRMNKRNQGGLFGMFGNSNQTPMQTGATMGSSSSQWGNSQNNGATYSASDGATITGLGNGTYARTNPITGGTSYWNENGSRSTKGY